MADAEREQRPQAQAALPSAAAPTEESRAYGALVQRKIQRRALQRKANGQHAEGAAPAADEQTAADREEAVDKEGGGSKGTPAKVKHTDPKDADKLIQKEMATYVKDLKSGDVAVGRVRVVAEAKFKEVYLRYIGDDGEMGITNAFVERNSPEGGDLVWIHEERGNAGTVIHEAMHLYSNTSFKSSYGFAANEGTTELFTRIITDKLKIARSNYDSELAPVKKLAGKVTNATLAGAYFSGAFDALRKAGGEAKFDAWVTAMKADKFDDARKALD